MQPDQRSDECLSINTLEDANTLIVFSFPCQIAQTVPAISAGGLGFDLDIGFNTYTFKNPSILDKRRYGLHPTRSFTVTYNLDGLNPTIHANSGFIPITNFVPNTLYNFGVKMADFDFFYWIGVPDKFDGTPIGDTIQILVFTTVNARPLLFNDNIMDGPSTDIINVECTDDFPQIFIQTLTLDDLKFNLGLLTFYVYDFVKYPRSYFCGSEEICRGVYKSYFSKVLEIQTVLRGTGCTFSEKVLSLINVVNVDVDYERFILLLSFYGSIRYILSGLLYGEFNVKYLLEKYYCQFLEDLGKSRFFRFLVLFTGEVDGVDFSEYYRYFLSGHTCGNVDGCQLRIRECVSK